MPQAAQRRPDDNDFDERGILRDGGRLRVDARFVDAHDRGVIDELRRRNPPRVDAFAQHRPHAATVDGEADSAGQCRFFLNRPWLPPLCCGSH